VFETVQQLLRARMQDDTIAVAHGERTWTWREHLQEAAAEASALIALAEPARPLHVGALLTNSPAMVRSMAAAALGGYALCGINTTRRGAALSADIRRSDCQLLLVDREHRPLLDGLELSDVTVLDVTARGYAEAVAAAGPLVPQREVTGTDTLMMIFTSGTGGDRWMADLVRLKGLAKIWSSDFWSDIYYVLGCFLTAILVTFGAPFWNDIASALLRLQKGTPPAGAGKEDHNG